MTDYDCIREDLFLFFIRIPKFYFVCYHETDYLSDRRFLCLFEC